MAKVKKAKQLEYGEVKVTRAFGLTPTGASLFRELAEGLGVSPSQLIEKIAGGS
jgi:hypothetical protein